MLSCFRSSHSVGSQSDHDEEDIAPHDLSPAPVSLKEKDAAHVRRLVLKNPELLDSPDLDPRQRIFLAAELGFLGIVKAALETQVVNLDSQNYNGDHLIHCAAAGGKDEVLRFLLQQDPSRVNMTNRYGETPLFVAAFHGSASCVRVLLEANANANLTNMATESPLYMAAYRGHRDIVLALLKSGKCDYNLTSEDGLTAFDVAISRGFWDIAQLIRRAIAWKIYRLIWIGHLKGPNTCPLHKLPKGIIVRILSYC